MSNRNIVTAAALMVLVFAAAAGAVTIASPFNSGRSSLSADIPAPPPFAKATEDKSAPSTPADTTGLMAAKPDVKLPWLEQLPKNAVLTVKRFVLNKLAAAAVEDSGAEASETASSGSGIQSSGTGNSSLSSGPSPVALAQSEASANDGTENIETTNTGGTTTGAKAGEIPPEKVINQSAAAGAAMGGFWKLAWAKVKPLLLQAWHLIASMTVSFFGALWNPATPAENAVNAPAVNAEPAINTGAPINAP